MIATTDTYFAPNKTIREVHDPRRGFSECAREELQAFTLL